MNWFMWTLLWLALSLGLIAMLAWGVLHLWRKFRASMVDVAQAGDKVADALQTEADEVPSLPAEDRHGTPVGWEATFADPTVVRAGRAIKRDERVEARRKRRIDMLWATGRPRRWGDIHDNDEADVDGTAVADEPRRA